MTDTHDLAALMTADLADRTNRLILADALEEGGSPSADLLRGPACPLPRTHERRLAWGWWWWGYAPEDRVPEDGYPIGRGPAAGELPAGVWQLLPVATALRTEGVWKVYRTRSAAYLALAVALTQEGP